MIPAALVGQLQQGLADFLRFSFWSSTPGMERVVDDLLAMPGGLVKGPYVSVKLPFESGSSPDYFPAVPLAFTPHRHQEQAFTRLGGRRKLSTLIATGTGSGKTESFLLPILDHCLADAARSGVKAILVYPMNALAGDQAGRIARLIYGNPALRGRVTAGLYIGDDRGAKAKGERKMGPATVITDRATLQSTPPSILLTNYKMLDYLLLRPRDQRIWRHNSQGRLRFVVVDEIHTFDGAQGTDLACLLRRLKRRLQVDDKSLCCIGTSATLGGPGATDDLRRYAERVFGEPFDEGAVVGESRLGVDRYLAGCEVEHVGEPGPSDGEALDPSRASDPGSWLRTQARLWFGDELEALAGEEWAVTLGERLRRHAAFHALLTALGGRSVALGRLVERLARQRSDWRRDRGLAQSAVLSLLALVSAAGVRREDAQGLLPFLDVRLQLWQRELRRMVATVGERPQLVHWVDLDGEGQKRHLPLVHCRECGAMGWGTRIERDKPHILRCDLDDFYRAYFSADPRVRFLFPSAAVPADDPSWKEAPFRVDCQTLVRLEPDQEASGTTVELRTAPNLRSEPKGQKLSRDCPFCSARDSLTILGFQASTLTSVTIDQLFASRFNDDKKLLAFSDSVQDAAHRAGFFGARTWRTNLRIAMLRLIRPNEGMTLAELADTLGPAWRERMEPGEWLATFLAPSMAWLHDWDTFKSTGELPAGSDLAALIDRRLAFEVFSELGLQDGIGRSLPRTGTATVRLDPERLERAAADLVEPLRNEVAGLRRVEPIAVRRFVVGLLHRLRTRGGILARTLPLEYVESLGKKDHAFSRDPALPGFGPTSRMPALLTDRKSRRFETWGGKGRTSWYARWVASCFAGEGGLTADAASVYDVVLPILVDRGLLAEHRGSRHEQVWGLAESALIVEAEVVAVRCAQCGQRMHVAAAETEEWEGLACLTARCRGSYAASAVLPENYFGRLYAGGDLQRIFPDEHTGLLGRGERERVEREFKAPAEAADGTEARKPWFANLLSCTPTLEMGIDIGDLSAAILCSVPPAQANYLQRIGRAGRKSGNALLLTVARTGRSDLHDSYFYAEPGEMIEGEVTPPGVFLDAPAVLERQLTAFCIDRWVADEGDDVDLPARLRTVFAHLDDETSGHFPFQLLRFVDTHQRTLLREFGEMFGPEISADTAKHLRRFLAGHEGQAGLHWKVIDALRRARQERDSHAARARALREAIHELTAAEARPADYAEQLEIHESEKEALLSLVQQNNRRHTLEFLTDEGLLPNYAFPESPVRLRSVIWRRKKTVPAKTVPAKTKPASGSAYETWTYEYARSPASAISELAPRSEFYAGGRRVRIDQVDLNLARIETWRFCSECSHARSIETGDQLAACPACDSASWRDEGQKFRLLKLVNVFANTRDRTSRIRDDREERRPSFFLRQTLVQIHDEDRGGAWRIDDDRLPFGFEYLRRATFREVNFGEPADQGPKSLIAGREAVRPGFHVCTRCGKVQWPGGEPEHSLACPSRKDGAKQQIEPCLYLYREFSSEALRLLLPMADVTTARQLQSFLAALQLGLRERFGGSVDHLRTTLYSDPIEGSALRKQFLVLYDTVPGGTGYLKQLVTPRAEGDPMPLFQALALAVERIESCGCWDDPARDGCYRCLYAYRNSREINETSSQVASELVRKLLAGQSRLQEIGSLSDISLSGLLDSVLEQRFLAALGSIEAGGRPARLEAHPVKGKPGYRWRLGDAHWIVEPQVSPPLPESGGVPVSIDFVLRPARMEDERRLAVFLDGWEFHRDRIGQDLRQRMALTASGRWDVWSLTWADVEAAIAGTEPQVLELAAPDPQALRSALQQAGLAAQQAIGEGSVFPWLAAELSGTGLPWNDLGRTVLASRMAPAVPGDASRWSAFAERVAPASVRKRLTELSPKLITADLGESSPHFELMAVHDGEAATLLCSLDDREEILEAPSLRETWRGYLRLTQLLRSCGEAWFMTRTTSEAGELYASIAQAREATGVRGGWDLAEEVEPAYRTLARGLEEAGVREPQVGLEIPDARGRSWAEAELAWEAERVAVTSRSDADRARGEPAEEWRVLYLEELADDPAAVIAALEPEGTDR